MIQYIKGNIFDSKAEALVNTVNTVGVMGKGLALQFKEAFPENYAIYRDACKQKRFNIGEMLITENRQLDGARKIIINFPTKTDWRKPSEYHYIKLGLQALKNEILERNITSIAIPPLGARNGGLDWTKVKQMIVETLQNIDCDITIYEPSDSISERMKKERVKLTPARAMMLAVMVDMVAHGEFVSEFAAEKIAYFLQRFGADDVFKLTFKQAVYGPYSGKVRYVLHYLNGSYIMGMSDLSKRPFDEIWLTSDAKTVVEEELNREENKRYKDIASKTMRFLANFYSNYSLELLSTIDFLLTKDSKLHDWRNMDEEELVSRVTQDIAQWNSRKERLFAKPQYVQLMLGHLKESF